MTASDVDLVEINEAFAGRSSPQPASSGLTRSGSTSTAVPSRWGTPFGMTGARITSTLINSLAWHDKQIG